MKKLFVIALLIIPAVLMGQNYIYGIGVILGSPTGLSGKLILGRRSAIAVHAGWSIIGDKGLHITGDHQFLFPGVIQRDDGTPNKDVVLYAGIGGRFRFKEREGDNDFHLGVRIGGGIEYFVEQFGFFFELYPVVDIVPETGFDFEGGIGARFYF
jgi:hypothetical protein